MARLSFRCDDELVARVDEARGLIPRETWLRAQIERVLQWEGHEVELRINAREALDKLPPEATVLDAKAALDPVVSAAVEQMIPDDEGIYPDCSPRCDVRGGAIHAPDCPHYRGESLPDPSSVSEGLAMAAAQHRSSAQSKRDVRPRPKGGK